MERRAKERLIGASILVVLVVLVVPELLSGPKPAAPNVPLLPAPSAAAPEPVRTVTVDLATSKSTATDTDASPIDSAANASVPAASAATVPEAAASAPAAAGALPATSRESLPQHADPKPQAGSAPSTAARTVDSAAAAPTSSHDWAVQLGRFANRGNAENLVHQLKSQGFPVYDSASGAGRAQRFRVRVGPLSDRAAADRTLSKLKALGHSASVVPPAR